jgi:hypothetical protein
VGGAGGEAEQVADDDRRKLGDRFDHGGVCGR